MADGVLDPLETGAGWGRWRWPLALLVAASILMGLVLRFVAGSPLWLDEALSVNIAALPLGEIPDALRLDGHPPLYYLLLHGWIDLFGTGPVAVRSLSGLWSVGLLPLTWVAARRLGGTRVAWYATALLAVSPFAIRYGTETRMYAMVSVLALATWLLVDDALDRPAPGRLVAIAALTGTMLWTHYWALWLLATAGIGLLVHAWRVRGDGRGDDLAATAKVIGALVVGGLTFLPWVPTLVYQGTHTGTPWDGPLRPTEMVANTVADLGGGSLPESVILGWLLAVAVMLGLFGRPTGRYTLSLDLRTRAEARPFVILVAGTLAIACAVGYATGATYATRYAAVIFPFIIVLAALGLDRLRSRPVAVGALAVLVALGGLGGIRTAAFDRSDAQRSVDAITATGQRGDWVVYCPDQLGPSGSRLLGEGFTQVTYPRFARPERVDWVDYKDRLAEAAPLRFAVDLLERAGGRTIFFVASSAYVTHQDNCREVYNALAALGRVPEDVSAPTGAFEPASVVAFRVAAPT